MRFLLKQGILLHVSQVDSHYLTFVNFWRGLIIRLLASLRNYNFGTYIMILMT
ncbi:hypothetical protein RchiOBHm_Chr2g0131601 [Rosa chinensis]|uniref:Uncharacterized protein n=1 Tax=Rosa chinensis TaxID=74649 RepID=A0A2P6RV39_ROSCH|nr:hypothetical protein RchiOBHm_Chr2g0131601 [Rosa chinensis]